MKLGRESKNFEDRTTAPWYDPHKLMANVLIEVQRLAGNAKQKQYDAINAARKADPITRTPQEVQADYNARVHRDELVPYGQGWTIKTPGHPIDTYVPDYVDSGPINEVLKQAGIKK